MPAPNSSPDASSASSPWGMIISGLMTPALIWVAPLMTATWPSKSFSSLKVLWDMFILPKPSVIISVMPSSSSPVMATPIASPMMSVTSV